MCVPSRSRLYTLRIHVYSQGQALDWLHTLRVCVYSQGQTLFLAGAGCIHMCVQGAHQQ